ncbi:MAG: carbon starvation protein A, partial [Phycisphaerae bacterium]
TYGRWLARKIFRLDPAAVCPSVELNDGHDYVPTHREIVFGHHFTSIAGTGPIVGPAIAVFWGWLPALLWVVFGSIFIGAVHDLGSLVVSVRSRGQSIGEVAARMINKRARVLFLTILFLALTVVIGIFGLVIAKIFAAYPISVFPIWLEIPLAILVGWLVYKRNWNALALSIVSLVIMYASVAVGAYWLPMDVTEIFSGKIAAHGGAAKDMGLSPYANAVVFWTILLLVYCFFASVLPVWTLLQPRDFLNSHQLIVALALLMLGFVASAFFGDKLTFIAPAVHMPAKEFGAPPLWPFLFITIACGAISGFHCLVASGTTSKQIRSENDAQAVGYGAMLLEGGLAVIVILACTAGLGKGVYNYEPPTPGEMGRFVTATSEAGAALVGVDAWNKHYGSATWSGMRMEQQIGAFIEGGANILRAVGIPITLAIGVMAVLVASFAATTLDTATRLQRYVITELGAALRIPLVGNRYIATTIAVVSAGAIALIAGPLGPGSGGLLLWPIFGATNQLLAGLAFVVIAFYLMRLNRPIWFLIPPLVLMIVLPTWAMIYQMNQWIDAKNWPPLVLGGVLQGLQIWMLVEAALLWRRVRGIAPAALPALRPA